MKINFLQKDLFIVDIGNNWLKFIYGQYIKKNFTLEMSRFIPLAEIKESIYEYITKIVKETKSKNLSVIACIPRNLVTVRFVDLPSHDPQEVKNMLLFQIGKHTPYSKDEIIFDYSLIDKIDSGYTKVMMVIARKNVIHERIEELEKAGLIVEKVVLTSEAIYRWFSNSPARQEDNFAILDIDASYSDFIVVRRGKFVFTRHILIGANQLISDLPTWQDKFLEECNNCISLYQNQERNYNIPKMLLSGSCCKNREIKNIITSNVSVSLEICDYPMDIQVKLDSGYPENFKDIKAISYTAILGAAGCKDSLDINLTPSHIEVSQDIRQRSQYLTITGILIIAFVMLVSVFIGLIVLQKNSYLNRLKTTITKLKNQAQEVEKMRYAINLVESRLDSKGSSLDLLREIYRLTPETIYFTNITLVEKDHMTLKGRALAMSDVFKFITTLENSKELENVKAVSTTNRKEKDQEYSEFEIVAFYQKM